MDPHTTKNITAKDVKKLLLKTYRRYKSGELSEHKALKETSILNTLLRAIELSDIEARIEKIEGFLNSD